MEEPLDRARAAYLDAVRRLARRDHSVDELRRALRRRGHRQDVVEATLSRLSRERALDDGRFAQQFARSRLSHQGLGQNRIRLELRRRGLTRATAERGVETALADVLEADVVDALARRYWARKSAHPPAVKLRRLWAFLVRRGFPASLVHDRLHALWPRCSDALQGLEPEEPGAD